MWPMLPNGIYCFNYHRIGDEATSQFDPNIFSCTAEQFEQHIKFYKAEFTVISVDELIIKMNSNDPMDKKYAVITFDDGYIDNYSIAFPILKKHNCTAAFYIATGYVNSPQIPWWDEIAWIIRHCNKKSIQLSNWPKPIDISTGTIIEKIRAILREFKLDESRSMADKITELETICQCQFNEQIKETQLFINWQQIKEMSENGMHIGSHSMSHNILSHLSVQEQTLELQQSKIELEQQLNEKITSLAYPVGNSTSFSEDTMNVAKEAGYELAFSFIPGIIRSFQENKYNLKRLPVNDNCNIAQLKKIIVRNT